MRLFSAATVFCLLFSTVAPAEEAQAKKKKKKLQAGQALKLTGQVVKVQKADTVGANEVGTITVKTLGKKGGEPTETVIKISKDTTLEAVPEPKKKGGGIQATTTAKFDAFKVGERVIVHTRAGPGNQAAWVELITPKKKNVLP